MDLQNSGTLTGYKQLFAKIARGVCPGYVFRPDMKKLYTDILCWCLGMPDGPLDYDKGLWLWGDIGIGKTTLLSIIREFCRMVQPPRKYRDPDNPTGLRNDLLTYGFRTTNINVVAGVFAKSGYDGIEQYIRNCRQAFDEVGRESIPTGYFGTTENVFQYIIQRRYDLRHFDFTHVTTNLCPDEIASLYGEHVFDRCREMFNFVEMSGRTWRENGVKMV